MCCDSWGRGESYTTEQLNCTELIRSFLIGLRFHFLKSQNCDYVESLFSGLELRLSDSILGLLSCFLTTKRIK